MKNHTFVSMSSAAIGGILSAIAFSQLAEAGSRRFGYSYETTTMPAGAMELETGVTWKSGQDSDGEFDFRHEFEFGFSDRLQLAFYFADWSVEKAAGKSSGAKFNDVAVEAIYNLTDPIAGTFGSALYGELKGSGDFIGLEGKLLLQKNIGSWLFVYNVGAEIAWENDYQNDVAELMQSAGTSYQINPNWSIGAEILHEIAVPGADTLGANGFYIGPDVSWRYHRISATVTGLWQLTSVAGEPDFQLRTILSVEF